MDLDPKKLGFLFVKGVSYLINAVIVLALVGAVGFFIYEIYLFIR